jgi:CRISPR-associated protein Cas1
MRQHHNVLYLTTPGAYLCVHDQAVEVRRDGQPPVRVPRHHLQAIICLGPTTVSPPLMQTCAHEGIAIAFLSEQGRFLARVVGPQDGNVHLRRAQYRFADDPDRCLAIARSCVVGKLCNARTLLRRWARDQADGDARTRLTEGANGLSEILGILGGIRDLDSLRGAEGQAAKRYFDCFPFLLRGDPLFTWEGRTRRPPMDPVNAVLSFLYSILATECGAAVQAVGLDPQVGFLHVEKPGRPALSLDLMEEFRPLLVDRLLFTLINRRQLQPRHVQREDAGVWLLTQEGRKLVLEAWHERKREEITHPVLNERTAWGLFPLVQARLLARHVRGDLDVYPPCLPD